MSTPGGTRPSALVVGVLVGLLRMPSTLASNNPACLCVRKKTTGVFMYPPGNRSHRCEKHEQGLGGQTVCKHGGRQACVRAKGKAWTRVVAWGLGIISCAVHISLAGGAGEVKIRANTTLCVLLHTGTTFCARLRDGTRARGTPPAHMKREEKNRSHVKTRNTLPRPYRRLHTHAKVSTG